MPPRLLTGALPCLLVAAACGCVPPGCDDASPPLATAPPLEPWAVACIPAPAELWRAVRSMGGEDLEPYNLPREPERLLARLTGVAAEEVSGAIDWGSPLEILLYGPDGDGPLSDGIVLVGARPGSSGASSGRRRQVGSGLGTLYVEARGPRLVAARSVGTLEQGLAHASGEPPCGASAPRLGMTVEVAPALLGSRRVRGFVDGQGARLEASARRATASRGRPSLGDPEALARMIARAARRLRDGAEERSPLRLTLEVGAEGLVADLRGLGGEARSAESRSEPPTSQLDLVPPDSFLVVAERFDGAARANRAREALDSLARIAGERMESSEGERLGELAARFAASLDGWATIAVRPGASGPSPQPPPPAGEPSAPRPDGGSAVLLSVMEAERPDEAGRALADLVAELERGYPRALFEHLGARIEVISREQGTAGEVLTLGVSPPDAIGDERGVGLRRLLGARPALAYRARGSSLLVALGAEPERELGRLEEAAEQGSGGSSALVHPIVATVARGPGEPSLIVFSWIPSVAAALTRGHPGGGGVPEGGVGLALGRVERRSHLRAAVDPRQLRSMLRLWAPRERP